MVERYIRRTKGNGSTRLGHAFQAAARPVARQPYAPVQGHHEGRRLLVTGNKRASLNTQKTCMAEDICVSKSCGHAYDRTATNFPFTIGYEKKMNSGSTTFDFKVRV